MNNCDEIIKKFIKSAIIVDHNPLYKLARKLN